MMTRTTPKGGPTSFPVEVKEPYTKTYTEGRVFRSNALSVPRNYVILTNKATKKATRLSYARYLFICDQYARTGVDTIPEGMEVDHINDNSIDDRIENLQLLTRIENIRKRDYKLYRNSFLDDALLANIRMYLDNGWLRREVSEKLNIPMGYLRYLIMSYIPQYASPEFIERNLNDIKQRLEQGATQDEVADEYGVHQATISRIVNDHFPHLSKNSFMEERLKVVREDLEKGKSLSAIGRSLGCDSSLILYYARNYLKDEYMAWKSRLREGRDSTTAVYEKGYILVASGMSFAEAARQLNICEKLLTKYVRKHRPEFSPPEPRKTLDASTKINIMKDLKENTLSKTEIAKKYSVSQALMTKLSKTIIL